MPGLGPGPDGAMRALGGLTAYNLKEVLCYDFHAYQLIIGRLPENTETNKHIFLDQL